MCSIAELPNISESYVHRIGRTGRAGRDGIAIAFCDETETAYLVDIQKLTGQPLEVIDDHEFHFSDAIPDPTKKPVKPPRRQGRSHQGRNQRRQGGVPTAPSHRVADHIRNRRESPCRWSRLFGWWGAFAGPTCGSSESSERQGEVKNVGVDVAADPAQMGLGIGHPVGKQTGPAVVALIRLINHPGMAQVVKSGRLFISVRKP